MGAAIGFSHQAIQYWERGQRRRNYFAERLALIALWYQVLDPVCGWQRMAYGLPPVGQIPPEVAQKLAQLAAKCSKGPGSQRPTVKRLSIASKRHSEKRPKSGESTQPAGGALPGTDAAVGGPARTQTSPAVHEQPANRQADDDWTI